VQQREVVSRDDQSADASDVGQREFLERAVEREDAGVG
jgi:hypothetical protein